mmetsp:Transcript_389/g.460  ORF Transcript_389/g.460 Transcript_389/m.460 type:complete len:234 (-) Transcript_389:151-852(-)
MEQDNDNNTIKPASESKETMRIDLPEIENTKMQRFTSQDWFGSRQLTSAETSLPRGFSFNDACTEEDPSTSALTCAGFHQSDPSLGFRGSLSSPRRSSFPSTVPERRHWFAGCHQQGSKEFITDPTELDVLLGRGGLTNNHPGNIRYRELTEEWKEYYQSQKTKDEKKDVSVLLLERVQDYGGRFLIKDADTGYWVVADKKQARKKCSQALRESKWKKSRKPTKSTNKDQDPG